MTQALGMGMRGPVEVAEIERLEDFYRRRGSGVYIEHCPLADPSLLELYGQRGYRLIEQTHMLARPLDSAAAAPEDGPAVTVRQPAPDEIETLALVVSRGFFPEGGANPPFVDLFATFCRQAHAACFLAELDGRMAGGGAVAKHDGVAALFGTSTLPEHRGRGAQTALIRARLVWAMGEHCDLAMVSASPGSISQRNLERQGFRIVYTRAKLAREWS
jgi:ribosomal protein S18 acetylase RimI-like enzyme